MGIPSALQQEMDALAEQNAQPKEQGVMNPPSSEPEYIPAPSEETTKTEQVAVSQHTEQANTDADAKAPESDVDWQERHNRMFGKLSGTISSLRAEINTLRSENERIKADAEKRISESVVASSALSSNEITDEQLRSVFSAETIEDLGEKAVRELYRALRNSEIAATNATKMVQQDLEQAQKRSFLSDLTDLVPNWETIEDSQGWKEFLRNTEPLTGATYESILVDAYSSKDAIRTAQLFKHFIGKHQQPQTQQSGKSVESLATLPGRSVSNAPLTTKMTMDEYLLKLQEITQSGLSPVVKMQLQDKLNAEFRSGNVSAPPPPASGNQWRE